MRLNESRSWSLESPIGASQIASALTQHLKRSGWECYVSGGVVGSLTDLQFQIHRQRPGFHSPFCAVFSGSIEAIAAGSMIVGQFQLPKIVRLGYRPALILAAAVVAIPALLLVSGKMPSTEAVFAIGVPSLQLLVLIGLLAFGSRQAEQDVAWLQSEITSLVQPPTNTPLEPTPKDGPAQRPRPIAAVGHR